MAESRGRQPDVTSLLERWSRDGQQAVLDRLVVALQADLRRLARAHMAREKANHTLQVTALVNETYIRLVDQRRGNWQNRAHFLGIAAGCMRRILVDHARRRKAQKRPQHAVDLDDIFASGVSGIDDVLPVHEALEQLAKVDPEQAQIVDLRFFAGLTIEEIAALRKISPATVKRELMTARVFLKAQLLDQRHDT